MANIWHPAAGGYQALITTARTTTRTGDIAIDPGANYRYDHWMESHKSGGWFRKKTTTDDARNFSTVLSDVQASGHSVTWVAHSRGGATFTEAARITEGDLSNNSVVFHAGANNRWVTNAILADRNITLANAGDNNKNYIDSHFDAVPNIIGFNGNPAEMLGSFVALPLLFMGPEWSPHTLPPKPPEAPTTPSGSPSMSQLDFAQP